MTFTDLTIRSLNETDPGEWLRHRQMLWDGSGEDHGYLEGWFVEPAFRQRGIGGELVRCAEDWARGKGSSEMASDAEIDNLVSIEAHNKLGYKETAWPVHLRKELT
jgi:GNAT superfamily N-acetyltransferase